jgi:hypothetical protein
MPALYDTLYRTYTSPVSISSDFARYKAQEIAALASMGLITTKVTKRLYGRTWRITEEGIETLRIEGFL